MAPVMRDVTPMTEEHFTKIYEWLCKEDVKARASTT